MSSLSSFIEPWRNRVASFERSQSRELPGYHSKSQADSLITSSCPLSFELGTGASIYTHSLLPAILKAQHEVILVTCFWASSSTLAALKDTLEQLATQRKLSIQANGPDIDILQPLRIRICFSSRSLLQKLFHTSSRDGYIYPPSTWTTQMSLPSQEFLEAGAIDLQIKSLFFLPFSVMHPKFLIIDRERAWLPSCNVSWEAWLEACVEITGGAVAGLMTFYGKVWERDLEVSALGPGTNDGRLKATPPTRPVLAPVGLNSIQSPARRFSALSGERTPTILLPSSHHRNPKFRPLPWSSHPTPSPTPLNIAVLRLLEMAKDSIYMQTPNVTTGAVVSSIIDALKRGVDVTIVTSKGMMVLEQIVTAGTTTALCLRSLIRRYTKLLRVEEERLPPQDIRCWSSSDPAADLDGGNAKLGNLKISYYHANAANRSKGVSEEPVHSHLKLTIVDGQYTVLGSGNMDRASWFTSQELGILFHSVSFANVVKNTVSDGLQGRTDTIFGSHQD
ncbi:hypothetical protein BJ170DRAFT_67918 [Xylariales sp. AK1849]|nr:hypothetical protein BJ170DRAFT_67918 [Xylariales sp. AK1849]